jgi:hypothetical protein
MKNLFLALALMLVGTFAFASNYEKNIISFDSNSVILDNTSVDIFEISDNHYVNLFKQCKVKIEGTIGDEKIDIDVEFTSDTGNCALDTARLIKELALDKKED